MNQAPRTRRSIKCSYRWRSRVSSHRPTAMVNLASIVRRRRVKIGFGIVWLLVIVHVVKFVDELWREESLAVDKCIGPCQEILKYDGRPLSEEVVQAVGPSSSEKEAKLEQDKEKTCDKRPTANTNLLGKLNVHTWRGWCGFMVDDLRRDPRFPLQPNIKSFITDFMVNVSHSEFLGRRIFGYVQPPLTGNYTFAVSSADSSELWLSSDESPTNARMMAYLGEAGFAYGASSPFMNFLVKKSQISESVSLIGGKIYYIEALHKQKHNIEHIEVAWQMPGSTDLQVVPAKYLSAFVDYSASEEDISSREECVMKNHEPLELRYTKFFVPEQYDPRDDLPYRVSTLDHGEVAGVLSSCEYKPAYLVNRKLKPNEAVLYGHIRPTLVYPEDFTDIYASNNENDINRGNRKMNEKEAQNVVSTYMAALSKVKGDLYLLKRIVNVEAKPDKKQRTRYLLELELEVKNQDRSVRLSEYVYSQMGNSSALCYPDGFQWRRDVLVTMVVTVKNYGHWIKFLVNQLENIYASGKDRNFHLVIVDFNSTDIDIDQLQRESSIQDRITILKKDSVFYKTMGLNQGVGLVKDNHSIIFTIDLHMQFPGNIFDAIRKHTIEGRSVFVPLVLKLKCGHTIKYRQGGWDNQGYGLFGAYKSDWDRFKGMNAEEYKTRWGGEDWDIMDRSVGIGLEAERLRQPKLYHFFHGRKSDWYEFARM